MRITDFLYYLDANQIDIWVEDNKLYVGMDSQLKIPDIHPFKDQLIRRLLNNEFIKSRGWHVGHFGEIYAYRYSFTGYIFIERNTDETVDVYRCKFDREGKPVSIKGLHEGISFSEAYQKTKTFLDWFYSSNPNLKRERY